MSEATEPTYSRLFRNIYERLKEQFPTWNSERRYREVLDIMRITDEYKPYYQDAYNAFRPTSSPRNYTGTWRDNYD